jgi:predicted branched-subunit amino acid permease
MTGRRTGVSLVLGTTAGLVAHVASPSAFSWWCLPCGAFAGFFALAAYVRRSRWEERSACSAVAAVFLALPFVGRSVWFLLCAVLIFAAYLLLLTVEDWKR